MPRYLFGTLVGLTSNALCNVMPYYRVAVHQLLARKPQPGMVRTLEAGTQCCVPWRPTGLNSNCGNTQVTSLVLTHCHTAVVPSVVPVARMLSWIPAHRSVDSRATAAT